MCADKTVFRHEKLPGYHDKPSSLWQRLPYRSDTGGVAPMFLEGLEKYTNHRIAGMTPDRRAWRKQWIQDQQLTHREPVHVPEIYLELNDPIRRAYKYPWNKFEDFLARYVSRKLAHEIRSTCTNTIGAVFLVYAATYYFMFNKNTWYGRSGIEVQMRKPMVYPGSPGYPFVSNKTETDHADRKFSQSPLYKSEERIRAEYEAELAAKKAAKNH